MTLNTQEFAKVVKVAENATFLQLEKFLNNKIGFSGFYADRLDTPQFYVIEEIKEKKRNGT